jgi:molybdopterin-guanine dinucleotide biosynthesis protein A
LIVRGAVLAGGAARRYGGRPKGLVELGGRRILDRVVDAIQGVTGELPLLVANAPDAATWRPDLRTTPDVVPGAGSLGGIYTAVVSGAGPVLCVAWDMPFVSVDLLRALVDVESGGGAGYDAFLPESAPSGAGRGSGVLEPLCAVYGPACGPAIERQMARGDLKAVGFHAAVKVGTLPLERVRQFGDPDVLFFNVNTPEDLARAEAVWQRRG